MQAREVAQQVEELVESKDMEMEQKLKEQDIDLMSRASKVTPQSLPPTEWHLVPRKQGEVVLIDDDPETNVYNLAFEETQQRIVQAQRK